MFLVAGLAVAGLVGIAAAFYFSIRSGRGGNKRLRPARAGHAGTDRRAGSNSHGTARPARFEENARRPGNDGRPVSGGTPANGSRRANGGRVPDPASRDYLADSSTGPNPALDFRDPALVGDRRGGPSAPGDAQATDPRLPAHAAKGADKPRRRVGFRKGADVDEELWPAEAFGGVSDEQFWDDLASDKPLATTARTAQQDPGPRSRLLDAAPPADTRAAQATGNDRAREDRAREDRAREDRAREDRARGEGRRGAGSGAYPESRTGPNPANERTMIQPAHAATQPVRSMTPQVPGATQPVQVNAGASQPVSAASQPAGGATPPAEGRGRRRASSIDDEDPLTSAAFSLRASGPVDGRSSRRPRDAASEQYGEPRPGSSRSSGPGPGAGSVYDATSPYPYAGTSHSDPSSVTQAMDSTPPYGENYGYGTGSSAAQVDDQRRRGGTGSHARHGGNGEGTRPVRRAYPQDGSQGTGYQGNGYPAGSYQAGSYQAGSYQAGSYQAGSYQAGSYQAGSYQAGSYQGNGRQGSHRAPYDPREDYRRLTHPR